MSSIPDILQYFTSVYTELVSNVLYIKVDTEFDPHSPEIIFHPFLFGELSSA